MFEKHIVSQIFKAKINIGCSDKVLSNRFINMGSLMSLMSVDHLLGLLHLLHHPIIQVEILHYKFHLSFIPHHLQVHLMKLAIKKLEHCIEGAMLYLLREAFKNPSNGKIPLRGGRGVPRFPLTFWPSVVR